MLHWLLQLIRYTFKDACSTASLKLRYANVDAPMFVRDAIGNRSGSIIMLLDHLIYNTLPSSIILLSGLALYYFLQIYLLVTFTFYNCRSRNVM